MGQKIKGGMWCDNCDKAVMGVKNKHGVRNTLSVGGALATGGLSLFGGNVENYVCPNCGGRVKKKSPLSGNRQDTTARVMTLAEINAAWNKGKR